VLAYSRRSNTAECIFRRSSQIVQDLVQLVDVTELRVRTKVCVMLCDHSLPALENGAAAQKLGQDASDRPHIDGS
jgi:hypothetical protein